MYVYAQKCVCVCMCFHVDWLHTTMLLNLKMYYKLWENWIANSSYSFTSEYPKIIIMD